MVDKGCDFYSRSIKSWLGKNDIIKYIKIHLNLKFIYMTSISKNVFTDKLNEIVNTYNNTYHSTIKMKPIDVKSNSYIDSS